MRSADVKVRTFVKGGMTQRLAVADLANGQGHVVSTMVPIGANVVVYTDPPWSPGNEKWWRRYADESVPRDYQDLLGGIVETISSVAPSRVFVEQSVNDAHRKLFKGAAGRCSCWGLALMAQWTAYYGNPARPYVLMHYGRSPVGCDPSGLRGEATTRTVFDALGLEPSSWVVDPCTGLGMSSRMADRSGCNFAGTELNPKRLDRTIGWLLKHGYVEQ